MAGLSTFDVGECCCDAFCGSPCSVCGGVHLLNGGTVTDDNGTWILSSGNSGLWGSFPGLTFYTQVLTTPAVSTLAISGGNPPCPPIVTGAMPYGYGAICSSRGFTLTQFAPAVTACGDPGPPIVCLVAGYATPHAGGYFPVSRIASVTCDGGLATAATTFPDVDLGLGCPIFAPPARNAAVSIPIETANSLVCCSPCPIPKKNLTVHWNNVLSGMGQTPLIYSPPGQWRSACSNQLLYALGCGGGQAQFSVTYFLTGNCPTGQRQSCTSPGVNPFSLVLDRFTCSPFMLHYRCTALSCVVLGDDGYTEFWITDP